MGSIGVFPSNYVTKLAPREKPLQCRAPVNINSVHGDGIIELLRDQVNNEKNIIYLTFYFLLPHTVYPGNNMCQKCGRKSGLWVLHEIVNSPNLSENGLDWLCCLAGNS